MRIAVVYSHVARIGGVETYLNTVIAELVRAGHAVSYLYEIKGGPDQEQISLPDDVRSWCVEDLGAGMALASLREWRPDLIYSHGLLDPLLEAEVLAIAPAVIFVHGYYGTCISGIKAFKRPVDVPCDKKFGWSCLLNYYPRGCGGWSPVTMITDYNRQSIRLKALQKYAAIVTGSAHMRTEYIRNGINPQKIFNTSLPVVRSRDKANGHTRPRSNNRIDLNSTQNATKPASFVAETKLHEIETTQPRNLLFLGRMTRPKGAHVFLDALTEVSMALNRPLQVTFAGDGSERRELERRAAHLQSPTLKIEFVGRVEGSGRDALLEVCDLLVVPSLWPEPFGLVGPEAGLFGVPVAAFDVGGIPDWLSDGVNGFLASGTPPTSGGLAQAIIKCLEDPATYAGLRKGASEVAQHFNIKNHLIALLEVFESVITPQ
jgi:glycosyltransferase involved in cell wall biosynthesis